MASAATSIPGAPEDRNIYEAIAGGKDVRRVPMTLGEALESARSSTR